MTHRCVIAQLMHTDFDFKAAFEKFFDYMRQQLSTLSNRLYNLISITQASSYFRVSRSYKA